MEYIKKLVGISAIEEISTKRREQIYIEKELDDKIKKIDLPCNAIMINFLLAMRETNRNRTQSLAGVPCLDYISGAQQHIQNIDDELKEITLALNVSDKEVMCSNFAKITANLENKNIQL